MVEATPSFPMLLQRNNSWTSCGAMRRATTGPYQNSRTRHFFRMRHLEVMRMMTTKSRNAGHEQEETNGLPDLLY